MYNWKLTISQYCLVHEMKEKQLKTNEQNKYKTSYDCNVTTMHIKSVWLRLRHLQTFA